MKYLIAGNSAAGISGAEAIRAHDRRLEITIVSEEDYPAYSRCLIPYFMEGKIKEKDMLYRPADYYKTNNIQALLGKKIVGINTKEHCVTLDNKQRVSYDRLLIATGGSPVIPDTPGMNMEGVSGFRTTKDMKQILARAKKGEGAVVLGGGCVGLMAASGLHALGMKVSIVIRSPYLLSQVADNETGVAFRRLFEAMAPPCTRKRTS